MSTTFATFARKAIVTRYLGPTDRRGSRVKAVDEDGNTVTLSWDSSINSLPNHQRAAAALCEKIGWHGRIVSGKTRDGYVHVWDEEAVNARD